jgi:hypothetical protein
MRENEMGKMPRMEWHSIVGRWGGVIKLEA